MEEVLILANQDKPVLNAVTPDLGIRGLTEFHVQDVPAFGAETGQKTRQVNRQLVIDEQIHDASRTG
jgi:hypothetical protein